MKRTRKKRYTTFVEIFVNVMLCMGFCELHENFAFLFDLNPPEQAKTDMAFANSSSFNLISHFVDVRSIKL